MAEVPKMGLCSDSQFAGAEETWGPMASMGWLRLRPPGIHLGWLVAGQVWGIPRDGSQDWEAALGGLPWVI